MTVRRRRKGLTDIAAVTQDVSFAVHSCRGWQPDKRTEKPGTWVAGLVARGRRQTHWICRCPGLVRVSLDPIWKEKVYRQGFAVCRFGSGCDPDHLRRPGVESKVVSYM